VEQDQNQVPDEARKVAGAGQTPKPRSRRKVFVFAACGFAVAGGLILAWTLTRPRPKCGPELPCADSSYFAKDSLGGRDVLLTVLGRWALPKERVDQVHSALAGTDFDFRNMRPGDRVTLQYRGLELAGLTYHKDLVTSYVVTFDSAGATAAKDTRPVDTLRTVVRGAVRGSLWNSMTEQGEPPDLVVQFAEILSYEVDFLTECNEGDSFEMLLDKFFVDSSFYRNGRVYAVHYRGKVGEYRGYYFRSPSGHSDFYNDKGQSLRKSVLRSPLTFANVTSRFGGRIHPISRVYRQHQGVDYGAPSGTKVAAIADGTVTKAGRSGGYGNLVEIRHAGGLSSRYGHLSGYGPGVRSGRSIRQGQTIGYVGSTGYSTGPHLHFEVRRNGKPVNPLKVIPPRAEPVPKKHMPEFERLRDSYLADLRRPAGPIRLAADSAR
jgi:hypothetical protein